MVRSLRFFRGLRVLVRLGESEQPTVQPTVKHSGTPDGHDNSCRDQYGAHCSETQYFAVCVRVLLALYIRAVDH